MSEQKLSERCGRKYFGSQTEMAYRVTGKRNRESHPDGRILMKVLDKEPYLYPCRRRSPTKGKNVRLALHFSGVTPDARSQKNNVYY